jgi:hypothetical protein
MKSCLMLPDHPSLHRLSLDATPLASPFSLLSCRTYALIQVFFPVSTTPHPACHALSPSPLARICRWYPPPCQGEITLPFRGGSGRGPYCFLFQKIFVSFVPLWFPLPNCFFTFFAKQIKAKLQKTLNWYACCIPTERKV